MELGAVLLISGEVFFGQHDGLAGEPVAEGVEGRSALAFGRNRAGGTRCVLAVDGGAGGGGWGCHIE
ncbi:MAG: hypothetical protein JO307_09130 [Bryobacterales bacterium]|nr:hypothetical protein [Bryobacterales bacterium]